MHGKFSRKIVKSARGVAGEDGIAEAKVSLENTCCCQLFWSYFTSLAPVPAMYKQTMAARGTALFKSAFGEIAKSVA
jgi:hypothetical protein